MRGGSLGGLGAAALAEAEELGVALAEAEALADEDALADEAVLGAALADAVAVTLSVVVVAPVAPVAPASASADGVGVQALTNSSQHAPAIRVASSASRLGRSPTSRRCHRRGAAASSETSPV